MSERKVFKFKLEPTAEQEHRLNCFAGAKRFVYNWGLNRCRAHYQETGKGISWKQLSDEFTALKSQPGFEWLQEMDSQALQQALADLKRAFINFFEKRACYPRCKRRKDTRQSFRIPQRVKIEGERVYVPKIGWIKIRQSRPVDCATKSATFKRDACGNWFVMLVAEFELPERDAPTVKLEDVAGGDVGLNTFLTLSDETEISNPRFYQTAERKLRRAQRRLSRKQKGSRNRAKARLEVAKVHDRIANQRADFTHQLSFFLISKFLALSLESVHARGLAKHLSLPPSPQIDFAFRDSRNATVTQQRIQSIFRDAKLFNQLCTALTLRVSLANLFSLRGSQFATFLGRQLNVRVRPAPITVQSAPQQLQETAPFQAMLLRELRRIQELTQQSVGREQATGFVRSPNRHAVPSPSFRRLKLPLSRPTELPLSAGRELHSLISSSSGANIEQTHTRGEGASNNLLFQSVARRGIRCQRVCLENKSIRAILFPGHLKVRVTVSAFAQFAFVLMKPLLNVLTLPDISLQDKN